MRLDRAWIGSVALAMACGESQPPAECRQDADCEVGLVCSGEVCVAPGLGPRFGLEIRPTPLSGLARRQLTVQPESGELNLALPEPAVLDVIVIDQSEGDERRIRALVDFLLVDETGLPGRRRAARLEYLPEELNNGEPSSQVLLDPDQTYAVRVTPGTGLPQYVQPPERIRKAIGAPSQDYLLEIPPYRRVSGTVVSTIDSMDRQENAEVQARGMQSKLLSTRDSGTPAGEYSILLPATGDGEFELLAQATRETEGPAWRYRNVIPAPTEDVSNLEIQLEPTREDLITSVQLRILWATSELGPSGGALFNPLARAQVTLTSTTDVGDTRRTRDYSVFGTTDEDGFLRVVSNSRDVPLLASLYVAQIQPAPNAPVQPSVQRIRLEGGTPQLRLYRLRTEVRFRLITSLGAPIPDAPVEAFALDGDRPSTAVRSDRDGFVRLYLDPGPHILVARPTRGTLPNGLMYVEVQERASQDLVRMIVPAASTVTGVVVGPGDAPLPETELEFFAVYGSRSLSLAQTRTDRNGAYTVRLPQELPELPDPPDANPEN